MASELLRLAQRLHYPVMLSNGTRSDLLQASRELRSRRMRQLERYVVLNQVPLNMEAAAQGQFPTILDKNTQADLEVLSVFLTGASDWLVTNDAKLRARAKRCTGGEHVLSLDEALDMLRPLISSPSTVPAVEIVQGYMISVSCRIFDSLRTNYSNFDAWWLDKVAREHRDIIILGNYDEPEGLAVLKPERDHPHGLPDHTLKVCTFKVSDDFRGTKRGELLLKAVIDYARRNNHQHVYMEVLPDALELLGWLEEFGFRVVQNVTTTRNELVLAKDLSPSAGSVALEPLEHNIAYGPGSLLVTEAYIVPIKDSFHHRLLPEADSRQNLFPASDACGNAIRKAYLCHANTTRVRPGDALLFLRTRTGNSKITCVGVTESTLRSTDSDEIVKFVGSRTVYSAAEIASQCEYASVLAIKFRLDRVIVQPWSVNTIRSMHVMNGTAQTIVRVPERGISWVRSQLVG